MTLSMRDETSVPYPSLDQERIGIRPHSGSLPASTHLGQVTLQIADLQRSLEFYEQVIGFRLLERTDGPTARSARLGVPDSDQVLLELHEKPGVRRAPHRGRLGLYHIALLLPSRADLGRFIRQALRQGVHVGMSDHLYSEATYLVDPDGLSVEVYRDRPRSEWLVSPQGEILSAGDPLDLEGLDRAAGDAPWRGLPVGTSIGHVHFYIGDIAQAAAFYHDALGFAKVTWRLPTALFVSAGGYHHHVGLNTWAAGSPASTDEDARLLTWELVLPDQASVDAAAERLRLAGFPVVNADATRIASDPWGIMVRLVASRTP